MQGSEKEVLPFEKHVTECWLSKIFREEETCQSK